MQHGNRLGGAVRLCEQARQDVGVVFAGERNDHLVTADIGFVEQVVVGDISLEDKTVLELFGKFAGPFGVPLDDHHLDAPAGQALRQDLRRSAAAKQHHPLRCVLCEAEQLNHQPSSPSFRHDPDMVAGFEPMITTRNDGLLTAPDRCDHEVPVGFEFLCDVAERPADERRFRRKAGPDDNHLSVRHVSNLIGAREVEQFEDLGRRFGIGVDEQVGTGGLTDRVRCRTAQAGGFDPADRLLDAHRLPHHGGDQVGLVVRCHGHEEFAVFHAGSAERFGMSATTDNRQDVERVIDASQLRAAEIDDRNVVTFSTQTVGHVRADLAGTHYDYVHRSVLLLCERDVEPHALTKGTRPGTRERVPPSRQHRVACPMPPRGPT